MRKVFLFDLITLDGYFEGNNQDISWHNVDEEFNDFAIEQLNQIGARFSCLLVRFDYGI